MTTAENSLLAPSNTLTPVGWAAVLGGVLVAVWSVPGLIINPDFAIGDDATSKLVLGVDMNGWHAVSGFLITVPAFLVARRPYLATVFCAASAGGLLATAAWAMVTKHAAGGLFYFPNAAGDVLLHVATSLIFLWGAVSYFRRA
jgi:hypothetical protein